MLFQYKAINASGSEVQGSLEADSEEAARNQLLAQDLIPSTVRAGKGAGDGGLSDQINLFLAKVNITELIMFSKQFRTLVVAGIPLNRVLEIMSQQTSNPRLQKVIAEMDQDVRGGMPLSAAFAKHPKVFSRLFCSMIEAGETSGRLGEIMERMIYLLQHDHKVTSDVKGALRYPMMILIVLAGAFLFLLAFIIPVFAEMFESAGTALPVPTQIAVTMYEWLIVYWPASLTVLVVTILAARWYVRTPIGAYNRDYLLLSLPILGPVFQKGAMSRFASIFAILQASGISAVDSLQILSGTIGNAVISKEFDRVGEEMHAGRGIAQPLKSAKFFTPMVVNMVAVGEESGNLDEMLREISQHYDDEVGYAVKQMSDTIGPVLIVALTMVVGFFAMAIFLPMWDIAGAMS